MEETKAKYQGIDPEQARQLEQAKRELEEKAALKAGEVDKVVASRVQSIKSDLERTTAERDSLNARLADIQINQVAGVPVNQRRTMAPMNTGSRSRPMRRNGYGRAVMIRHHGNTERRRRVVIPIAINRPGYARRS